MLKKDSLTAQMQQLSHTLAKVKRLMVDGEIVESRKAIEEVLATYYGTSVVELIATSVTLFKQQLAQQAFVAEELARLADFLDLRAQLEPDVGNQQALWQKVILLYDVLEETHQTVSFEHIMRRATIEKLIAQDNKG